MQRENKRYAEEMLLMSGCPKCGAETNITFVEDVIDRIVDRAVAEERKRMSEIIKLQYEQHTELLKALKDSYLKETIMQKELKQCIECDKFDSIKGEVCDRCTLFKRFNKTNMSTDEKLIEIIYYILDGEGCTPENYIYDDRPLSEVLDELTGEQ